MKHARADAVSHELPDEIVYSILLNLPPKTLLRFRTTCKRWRDIIASRTFARHHCNRCRSKPRADHLFIHNYVDDEFQLPHEPVKRGGCWFESSSWDGMLCTPRHEANRTATILVWNPFTRRSRRVPWPVAHAHRAAVQHSFVGFGHDPVTDDYKIVVHTQNCLASASGTYVMALGSSNNNINVWRKIEELSVSWGRRDSKPVTMDNGDVYWISRFIDFRGTIGDSISQDNYWTCRTTRLRFLILKFNFTDERVSILPSPPQDNDLSNLSWMVQLGQYGGSLCFFNYQYLTEAPRTHWIRIWTLSGARDGDSSSKAATWVTAMHVPFSPLLRFSLRLDLLGFTISGDLMMRGIQNVSTRDHQNDLMVYLVREDKFVIVRLDDDNAEAGRSKEAVYYHLLHTESLISPDSFTDVPRSAWPAALTP